MLLYEAKLLKHLEGGQGFSSVYFSGREGPETQRTATEMTGACFICFPQLPACRILLGVSYTIAC